MPSRRLGLAALTVFAVLIAALVARAGGLVRSDLVDVDCAEFPCLAILRNKAGEGSPESELDTLDCAVFGMTGDASGSLYAAGFCDAGIDPAHYPRVEARMIAALETTTR